MQAVIVAVIVSVAAAYAAWTLMPVALRRWVLAQLRRLMPAAAHALLARLNAEETGCNSCKGCATDAGAPSPAIKTIELHRR
jgi:hypothetical protein